MTEKHLRVILIVAGEKKSITRAAEALGVSRQRAHQYLVDMEKKELVERGEVRGRWKLTPRGVQILTRAKREGVV